MNNCDAISKYRDHTPCQSRVADYICKKCRKRYCERHMQGKYKVYKQKVSICIFCELDKPLKKEKINYNKRKSNKVFK